MGGVIHISIRNNLFYPINLVIHYYLRKIVSIIIASKYKFNDSLIYSVMMLFGEFFAGLAIYIYQFISIKRNQEHKNISKYFGTSLFKYFKYRNTMKKSHNNFIIVLLIFFAAYFNLSQFIIASFYIPKFNIISQTASYRFGGIIIIVGALICHFNLRIRMLKHHFYSLIILAICSLIVIIIEFIYRRSSASIESFFLCYLLVIFNLVFVAFTDVIEKYLLEYDYMNPFLTLFVESIFGFILLGIFSIQENPFKDIKRLYNESSSGDFALLLFLLLLYFVFSAGTNTYKIITNGLYSPMVKTLVIYILNPTLFIYYFAVGSDFMSGDDRNWIYFIISLTTAIIISFFGCVFNEFLVLSCCGLDKDTHYAISKRAIRTKSEEITELSNYTYTFEEDN